MSQAALQTILDSLGGSVTVTDGKVQVTDEVKLRNRPIDLLANTAVFGTEAEKPLARWLIWEIARTLGIYPSTIHDFYMARGRDETPQDFTVPAMNLRTLTYDMARAVFRAAVSRDVGAMIFEIARSEIGYTDQRPSEYTSGVLAAAIKEGFRGPVFIQGDHFQVSAKRYAKDSEAELQAIRDLIDEAIAAGFFNIDVDTSTLVDLSKGTLDEQQALNYTISAEMTAYIRRSQPDGIEISVGGEIGEVGKANSTEPELRAYMDGYKRVLAEKGDNLTGLSKISVQTGTSHGGVVLPDGSIAMVKVDFDTLRRLSVVAREYGMAGAVQHGASTLPPEAFHKFAESTACEVHLATGFQNILFDHEHFPTDLRDEMYAYLDEHFAANRKPDQTDQQFYYKERKRALGPFKHELWGLPESLRGEFRAAWEDRFGFLFEELNVVNTREMVQKHVKVVEMPKKPEDFGATADEEDVSDLAD